MLTQKHFTDELFQLLDETFENVHGIYLDKGTSLCETLEELTAEAASRPISARATSVAAHVGHALFYLEVLERYLQEQEIGKIDWEESWTTKTVTPEEWVALKQRLKARYHRLLEQMRALDDWEGKNSVASALAILTHTAYHLGALRLALNVLP